MEEATVKKAAYRPEIDGLRAVAVTGVIVNHFNKEFLPGGYLGVDLFFVISGFVITLSLQANRPRSIGDFLIGFYSRRIKRLVPALAVCLIVTSLLVALVDPQPEASLEIGKNALIGFSNILLYRAATNYFATSTDYNAFAHTWSPGVEEQFYFFYPLLYWLCTSSHAALSIRIRRFLFILIALVIFALLSRLRTGAFLGLLPLGLGGSGPIRGVFVSGLRCDVSFSVSSISTPDTKYFQRTFTDCAGLSSSLRPSLRYQSARSLLPHAYSPLGDVRWLLSSIRAHKEQNQQWYMPANLSSNASCWNHLNILRAAKPGRCRDNRYGDSHCSPDYCPQTVRHPHLSHTHSIESALHRADLILALLVALVGLGG